MTALEPIVGRRERGWIATGKCGGRHLVGGGWSWWQCPTCTALAASARNRSRDRITAQQARLIHLYYGGDQL